MVSKSSLPFYNRPTSFLTILIHFSKCCLQHRIFPDRITLCSHSLFEDTLEDQEFLKLVEVNSIFFSKHLSSGRWHTQEVGKRCSRHDAKVDSKCRVPQVDDDHVSKWRASRWCSYLNMLKLSGLWRTTSPCHCVHKGLWYESLCVISRRKRY